MCGRNGNARNKCGEGRDTSDEAHNVLPRVSSGLTGGITISRPQREARWGSEHTGKCRSARIDPNPKQT